MGSQVSRLLAAFAVIATGACRPLLDGGWDGVARCESNAFPLTAVFNENGEGEIDGIVYIDAFLFGFIAKGVIEDGERNPDDGSYSFDLEIDDDEAPDFAVEMEYSDDQFEELDGTVDILDGNGEATDSCAMDLERVSVSD